MVNSVWRKFNRLRSRFSLTFPSERSKLGALIVGKFGLGVVSDTVAGSAFKLILGLNILRWLLKRSKPDWLVDLRRRSDSSRPHKNPHKRLSSITCTRVSLQ